MSVFIRTSVEENNKKYDYNNNETKNNDSTSSTCSEKSDLSKLVRLSLNKPKEWNWELSTSKSSPHIAFPVIQLYDSHTGNLLVEADDDDCVYQGNEKLEKQIIKGVSVPVRPRSHTIHESLREKRKLEVPLTRSQSGSSKRSLMECVEDQVNSLVEQLSDQGIKCNIRSRSVSRARSTSRSIIPEEPIEEEPKPTSQLLRIPNSLSKSRSATEIMNRPKKYSRSSSSVRFTTSFLQRVSECRDGDSSSDSELDAHQKRYFYRSSKAGTLLLCEENFNDNKKRNRRSRNLDSSVLPYDDATQTNNKNETIEREDDDKKLKRISRKNSSKLKFVPINDDKIVPEEIEKKLNLNCIKSGADNVRTKNDSDDMIVIEKELNNARDYSNDAKNNRLIRKSILSKSNNDLSLCETRGDMASPLVSHMRNSCGNFLMENLVKDDSQSDSNTNKRLNRRHRRHHHGGTSNNPSTTKETKFYSDDIKNPSTSTTTSSSSSTEDDEDIDKFVEKTGTKAQQLRLQRPERGKKRSSRQNVYRRCDKASTDEKIDGKSFVNRAFFFSFSFSYDNDDMYARYDEIH